MQATLSLYCFVSGGSIHCVPVNSFNEFSNLLNNGSPSPPAIEINPVGSSLDDNDTHLKIKNRNLLYTLNNPSLSDLESDTSDIQDESLYLSGVINNYSTHALYLPDYSIDLTTDLNDDYPQAKELLRKTFSKNWSNIDKIQVKRLTGGITNMLLKCSYGPTGETVLMRVYGKGTNLIIDRHREFILHLVLNSMNLAPPVHARFKNGLIYGFLEGRSLEPSELKHKNLYPLIAQQLGNWHSRVNIEEVRNGVNQLRDYTRAHKRKLSDQIKVKDMTRDPNGTKREKKFKKRYISNIWELIEDWINIVPLVPALIESFKENSDVPIDEDNMRQVVMNEFNWLKEKLTTHIVSPTVSSHCDLLSGNIIIPSEDLLNTEFGKLPSLEENPIKFIDYEYMLPAPRSFDIANHLAEWQGFECDRASIPEPTFENETLVKWVKAYLNNEEASDEEVKALIDEIHGYYGLPGFYWGIWAAIQSEISNIDFNYSIYSKLRLQEYWDWKSSFKFD